MLEVECKTLLQSQKNPSSPPPKKKIPLSSLKERTKNNGRAGQKRPKGAGSEWREKCRHKRIWSGSVLYVFGPRFSVRVRVRESQRSEHKQASLQGRLPSLRQVSLKSMVLTSE